jgi:lysine 2,3-aminomutase
MEAEGMFHVPVGSQAGVGACDPAGENDDEPPSNPPTPLRVIPFPLETEIRLRQRQGHAPSSRKRIRSGNPTTREFRRRFFPSVDDSEWNSWQWQVRNRIRRLEDLDRMLRLTLEERTGIETLRSRLPVAVTPYYMSLLSRDNGDDPLRRSVIPTVAEFIKMPEEADDPLGEEHQSPVPGLVHRYPDRVLLLALDFCSTYCRYCTRSRVVGHSALHPSRWRLEAAVEYIRRTPAIRDVLISGGDPLTMGDERLKWLLERLRAIQHVEIIRIGTKVPAVLPQRITPALVRMLRKFHPLWLSLHFTHPDECTPEAHRACNRLADAGIPLGSQTVLLRGINDSVETMKALVHQLMRMRVRPYYLYQCDPISGSSHFRTSVETGLDIIRGLRGFTSGYAVPTYVIDAPGGGGKIPMMPDYVVGCEKGKVLLRNYENRLFAYPSATDPDTREGGC